MKMKLLQIIAPEKNKIVYMIVLFNIILPNFLGMEAYKSLS